MKALNKCYADDLLILAAKREALQQKADIMSAIAIIFKMKKRNKASTFSVGAWR